MAARGKQTRVKKSRFKRSTNERDELVQKWVESKQGVIVDEQWLAKRYAQARADYHKKPQNIWKHWYRESWVVEDAGRKSRPEEHTFLMGVSPSTAKRLRNALLR